jgi:hypothetical protein
LPNSPLPLLGYEHPISYRFELDEMKSSPYLLGSCTYCPVLHEKLDVSLVYARFLEGPPCSAESSDSYIILIL